MNRLIRACLLLLVSTGLQAQTFASLDEFKAWISDYVTEETPYQGDESVSVSLLQIDSSLIIPNCPSSLVRTLSQRGVVSATNSVRLTCSEYPNWSLHVPIQIKIMTKVVVAGRMISAKQVIGESDVIYKKHDKNQMQDGYFKDKREVIGLISARLIPFGVPYSRKNLKQSAMIKRNQTMSLILKHGTIEISMIGVAKSDGYLNETVKVFNPSSKKTVDALVTAKGRAVITY